MVDRQYSNEPPQNPGWYASLNAVFAVTYRLRVSAVLNTSPEQDAVKIADYEERAERYYKNATSVLMHMMMLSTDLWSIQAMLQMVCLPVSTMTALLLTLSTGVVCSRKCKSSTLLHSYLIRRPSGYRCRNA